MGNEDRVVILLSYGGVVIYSTYRYSIYRIQEPFPES